MPLKRAKAAIDQLRKNIPMSETEATEITKPVGPFGVITRHMVLTRDLGVGGNLYGGVMLSWIDEAAVIYAMLVIGSERLLTRAFKNAEFQRQVKIGDLVEFLADGYTLGRTSITVNLRVVINDVQSGQHMDAHAVTVTLVHINKNGLPVPISIPKN
ncbi:MAG: hypothetical protein OEM52_12865 [bacterium]|nr:hypothetical protein [bacterium]